MLNKKNIFFIVLDIDQVLFLFLAHVTHFSVKLEFK